MKTTPPPESHDEASAAPELVQPLTTTTASDVLDSAATALPIEPAPIVGAPAMAALPLAAPASAPPVAHPSTPMRRSTPLGKVALAAVAVLAIAALAFPRRPPAPSGAASNEESARREQPTDIARSAQPVPPVPALNATPASSAVLAPLPSGEPSGKLPSTKTTTRRTANAAKSAAPVAQVEAIADTSEKEDTATKPAEPEPTPAVPAAASTEHGGLAPVTITGCLEMSVNKDEFRLTDTEGADAPKSRSWRTGFLRKRSAPVALVDLSDLEALHPQVGKRVAATGQLTSRELKVNSLRVVGPCS